MTHEEILFNYYLKYVTKSRNEAIKLLKERNFDLLNRNYLHWIDKQERSIELESTLLSEVIKELNNTVYQDNEGEPFLSCCIEEDESVFRGDTESSIKIISYIYNIVPFEKCESLARNYTNNAIWKIKHQPNGKDAKGYLDIISKRKL
jgi:hypothetical protein